MLLQRDLWDSLQKDVKKSKKKEWKILCIFSIQKWKIMCILSIQSVVSLTAESALFGSLLEMQTPWSHQLYYIKICILTKCQ